MSEWNLTVIYGGKTARVPIAATATGAELFAALQGVEEFNAQHVLFKCVCKGKQIAANATLVSAGVKDKSKIMAIGTAQQEVESVQEQKRTDPLVKDFDAEERDAAGLAKANMLARATAWGEVEMDKDYKFARFGTLKRFEGQVPHPFAARELLRTLATDPGIVHIMREFELVAGTLEEMDPDDRLAEVKAKQTGGCLLGYNVNHGAKIYIRLRLEKGGFRPYEELVDTLLHELTHNLVGDHDVYFWRALSRLQSAYLRVHMERHRHPLRFPRPKHPPPAAEAPADEVECEEFVLRKLQYEAGGNGALQPAERAAVAAIVQEVSARVEAVKQRVATMPPAELVVRSAEERDEVRKRAADAAMKRLGSSASSAP